MRTGDGVFSLGWIVGVLATLLVSQATAQDAADRGAPSPQPASEQGAADGATEAAEQDTVGDAEGEAPPETAPATVIDVAGSADRAPAGTSPLADEGWQPIETGDVLSPGTLIRTGLRSRVNLQFGETTTISVRSASFASIDQFFRSATTERVRMGLGYGTVRGGSTEGTIRGNVAVDTPVATLAKRGTEGWQISVEAGTGRFAISLAEHGLVEAIARLRGGRAASRTVRPGEYANHINIANMWIEQDLFDRKVWLYGADGLTPAEAEFASRNNRGFATLAPGSGMEAIAFSSRRSGDFVRSQTSRRPSAGGLPAGVIVSGPIERPEGNFGTAASFKLPLNRSLHRR